MASAAASGDRSVSVGRVFNRAFGTVGASPVATLGIAFLFGGLPSIALGFALQRYGGWATSLIGDFGVVALTLLIFAAALALGIITQGALVRATIAHADGRVAGFSESASAGLAVALPLFVMALLSGIGIGLGFVLLVVPGLMLYVIWAVAGPALVEERLGPIRALGRSRDLTRGARWKVFGVAIVVSVATWIGAALVGLLNVGLLGGSADLLSLDGIDPRMPIAYYAVNALFQTVSLALWGVVQASLYVELREWREGPRTDALADIFG